MYLFHVTSSALARVIGMIAFLNEGWASASGKRSTLKWGPGKDHQMRSFDAIQSPLFPAIRKPLSFAFDINLCNISVSFGSMGCRSRVLAYLGSCTMIPK